MFLPIHGAGNLIILKVKTQAKAHNDTGYDEKDVSKTHDKLNTD